MKRLIRKPQDTPPAYLLARHTARIREGMAAEAQLRAWKRYRKRNREKFRAIDRERKRREYAANPEPFKARARKAWVLRKRRESVAKEAC